MSIPVIINNRDLLTWPKAMVERIKQYNDVGRIIIIDNESTYQPLLEWYETKPCEIIRVGNLGHRAPWDTNLVRSLKSEYYVVTDPDLDLSQTPDDTLQYLREKILDLGMRKLGLMLDLGRVTPEMTYYKYLQWYEKGRRHMSGIINDIMIRLTVDTTFAIYPGDEWRYFVGGSSTLPPYQAGHMPWYYTKETMEADQEYMYYLNHASNSASIKQFLTEKQWVE
jgi:hypothetical protein